MEDKCNHHGADIPKAECTCCQTIDNSLAVRPCVFVDFMLAITSTTDFADFRQKILDHLNVEQCEDCGKLHSKKIK